MKKIMTFIKTTPLRLRFLYFALLFIFSAATSTILPLIGTVYAISDCDKIAIEKGSLFADNDKCKVRSTCQTPSNETTIQPGSLFIIGDSIGEGVKEPLQQALGTEWSVSGDTRPGRPLKEGVAIVNGSPPGLTEADHVLSILGTNNLDSTTNDTDTKALIDGIKKANPSAKIHWLNINVTRSDLIEGAKKFNVLLNGLSDVNIINNTTPISGDGVHPADYNDLATIIQKGLSTGGGSVQAGECVCSVNSSPNLNGSDNPEKIWNYFSGKGLKPFQVAGILGNLQQESGMDPEKIQGGSRSQDPNDAGGRGWGLMQWTPATKIFDLMKQAGITSPVYDLSSQLELVWWHMNNVTPTGRRNFIEGFRNTTSVEDATSDFEKRMEGAGQPMLERRIQYANDFLTLYGQGSSTSDDSSIEISTGGCSSITGPGENTQYIDGFTIYSQYDPAWKDLPYSTSTIGKSGCGPAAMAMIITALTENKVTPVETAKYAAEQNLYTPGAGSSWDIGPVLAKRWGLKAVNIGVDAQKIATTLQAGGLVITAGQGAKPFTSGGHFIVIRGITADGKYKVGDSGHSDTSDKEWDSEQILASMAGRDGSVYAITK